MAIPKVLVTLLVVLVAWWLLGSFLGIPFLEMSITAAIFIVTILSIARYFKIPVWWIVKAKKMNLYIAIIGAVALAWMGGWLGGILQPGAVTPTVTPAEPSDVLLPSGLTECQSVVSEEIRGTSATLLLDGWDMESNTPYAGSVDVGAIYCFRNGNEPSDHVIVEDDTTAGSVSGYAVGDVGYFYGNGGATYTIDPIEGLCIDSQRKTVNINAHRTAAATDMQITGYDDTGAAALTAGPTSVTDYNITLATGGSETFYLKLKVNTVDRSFNFMGWGIAAMNISSVKPLSTGGRTYTQRPTYLFLNDKLISINETQCDYVGLVNISKGLTVDYVPYTLSAPLLMHEWDSIKDQFEVKETTTGNSESRFYCREGFNGAAIIALDAQYSRGTDGGIYLDIYNVTAGEEDAGIDMATQLGSPLGKDVSTLIGFV